MTQELVKPKIKEAKEFDLNFNNYIEACRWILKEHQYLTIDDTIIDAQTANAIITVYDTLNEYNQGKALFIHIKRFAKFAWKQVRIK